MAMIDYGTIVTKNEMNIQNDMFMNLSDIGVTQKIFPDYSGYWSNDGSEYVKVDGNYFGFAGDDELFLCFYKLTMFIIYKHKIIKYHHRFDFKSKTFRELKIDLPIDNASLKMKSYDGAGRREFVTFKYKGDTWKIVYGHGIDFNKKIFDKVWKNYKISEKEKDIIDRMY